MTVRWKRKHVLEMILLIVGILSLGVFLWDQAATQIEQRQAESELEQELQRDQEVEKPKAAKKKLKRGETVGRVEIPRLKIAAVVRSGVDDTTLKRAVGHVPSTPLPGQPGNVGLAAHRDSFFRNLKGVRKGDLIRMVTPDGEFEYKVESTTIVTPKNVEVLDPTTENAMTLVTCYPFNYVGSAPNRFIVRAKQLSSEGTVTGRNERGKVAKEEVRLERTSRTTGS